MFGLSSRPLDLWEFRIKPPPPKAPKPRAKRTSSGQSSDNAEDKSKESKSSEKNETDLKKAGPAAKEFGLFDAVRKCLLL